VQSPPNGSGCRRGGVTRDQRTPEPPDPQTARAARRLILHFTLLILAALATASLPLPAQAAALLFSIAGIVVGARAMRVVWRPGLREELAPLLALGLAFAALLTLSLAATLALWPVQMEHQTCLSRALTLGARQDCETRYQESLTERLDELSRRGAG
jgi:uncharacterized protein involved in response to NO